MIVVGEAPGKKHITKSPTRLRVKTWLGSRDYEWTNKSDNDLDKIKCHDKVLALGNVASEWLSKHDIPHLKVPHPSGLNRMWNDKTLESKVVEDIHAYCLSLIHI